MVSVSVIVPMYNVGNCIKRTIEVLNKQTFQDFEIILINDGSTDNTHEICQQIIKENDQIVYIRKENGGAGSARNAGLEVAKGKYIYFIIVNNYIVIFPQNNK